MESERASSAGVLEVAEAPDSDFGLGCARLDSNTLATLGFEPGTVPEVNRVLEIGGKKTTVAKVLPLAKTDERKGIIRIDRFVRGNAGVSIGDKVTVRRVDALPAERVKFDPAMPAGHRISFGKGIEKFVKRGLFRRPLVRGDVVVIVGIATMSGPVPFVVMETVPDGAVRIADQTEITLAEEPVIDDVQGAQASSPESSPEEILSQLADSLERVRREYDAKVAGLEGEAGERARKLMETLRKLLREASDPGADPTP